MADHRRECFAKLVLEEVCGDRFRDLKRKDRPDLQSEELNVGVEVTTVERHGEEDALARKAIRGELRNPTKTISELQSNGMIFVEMEGKPVAYFSDFREVNHEVTYELVSEKLKKLSGYHKFENQYLFIIDNGSLIEYENDIPDMSRRLKETQESFDQKFSSIFICNCDSLWEFSQIEGYNVERYKIPNKRELWEEVVARMCNLRQ